VADNSVNNHSRGKIVHRVRVISKIANRNLRVPETRLRKVEADSNPQDPVDKIVLLSKAVATSGITIPTGPQDPVDKAVEATSKDKTATGQTEVAAREISNRKKIKIPATAAGRKNNEVLK
jgi:hypothetical protein